MQPSIAINGEKPWFSCSKPYGQNCDSVGVSNRASKVVENAKNGVVRPLLEVAKHGYGDEASDTTSCALPTFAHPCDGLFY